MLDALTILALMPPVAPAPIPVGAEGTIESLPDGVKATAIAGLIAGLLLWALGGRMIKLAMAVLGAAIGAGLGSMLVPTLGLTAVAGFPAHLVGLAGGAVAGLVVAILLFRFAMVIAGAGVVGAAAALGGLVYVNVAPPPADMQTHPDLAPIVEWDPDGQSNGRSESAGELGSAMDQAEDAARDLIRQDAEAAVEREAQAAGEGIRSMVSQDTADAVEEASERVRAFVHNVWRAFVNQWNALDAAQRLVLAGFVVVGLAAGALIGLAMPTKSAAMLTSLAGSAVWLASLAWLAEAMALPGRDLLTGSGNAGLRWLIVWPVVAVIGLVFQMRNLRASRDGPGRRRPREGEGPKPDSDRD